jgi:hypothetical protein
MVNNSTYTNKEKNHLLTSNHVSQEKTKKYDVENQGPGHKGNNLLPINSIFQDSSQLTMSVHWPFYWIIHFYVVDMMVNNSTYTNKEKNHLLTSNHVSQEKTKKYDVENQGPGLRQYL